LTLAKGLCSGDQLSQLEGTAVGDRVREREREREKERKKEINKMSDKFVGVVKKSFQRVTFF
jgi:hypothetical protein